ncbi:hypothetical protein ACTMU2_13725 [Cupriavidus basilensis]
MKLDLARDGTFVARGLFSPEGLKRMREAFDYGIEHPSPQHGYIFKGTPDEHFNDYGNIANRDVHIATIKALALDELRGVAMGLQACMVQRRGDLHQKGRERLGDRRGIRTNSYTPVSGPQMLNIWDLS